MLNPKWRDPYLWSEVDVLKNKFGIKNQKELNAIESNYTSIRALELREKPIKGFYDLHHLREIHQYLFQDVYFFAGEIRAVDVSKASTKFAAVQDIRRLSNWLFNQLQNEKCLKKLDADKFSERAALYLNAINAIHPFREGNGRTQRLFIEDLSKKAGHPLNLRGIDKEMMIQASLQGGGKDLDSIVAFDIELPTLFMTILRNGMSAYADSIKRLAPQC
ncbi:MAG: Fic family protein [Gammaproteobacteria bacterium]